MTSVQFLLDEHISAVVASELRRRGIACLTVAEAGRRGLPDAEQLTLGPD